MMELKRQSESLLACSGVAGWRLILMLSFLSSQICDIAINWAGGLHHAKKFEVRPLKAIR